MIDLPADIDALTGPVVFFPVRHHSPTAARIVRELIERLRPAAVLIEGPSDFNDRLDELALDHHLPIAIYSYVRRPNGTRHGAYYPFCIYTPEWQAFLAGRRCGAVVRFIDLPYADIVADDDRVNRYADADFRRSRYVQHLCAKLGVDNFDAVWDAFFELDAWLTAEQYLWRAHRFCGQMRLIEGQSRPVDRRREAFMAAEIRAAIGSKEGQVLVVTGGYHSLALHARLCGNDYEELTDPPDYQPSALPTGEERGIAITPYSYERLDGLKGYEAGMPNPGFYHRLWQDRQAARPLGHRKLLFEVSRVLRQRQQRVSSADLIAAESCAAALSRLRAHGEVWRTDLVDGLIGALIKDELAAGGTHPLLDAIHEVLRGDERGVLSSGAALPPLVKDVQRLVAEHNLLPAPQPRTVELDLCNETDRERSRLLHRLTVLGIAGYARTAGTDFAARNDLSRLWENWEVRWSPEFDSSAIEAARYGATLIEAAANRLAERASTIERSADRGAQLLLAASLAGLNDAAAALQAQTRALVRNDGEFLSVTAALGHLLYLYRYDEVMQTGGRGDVGEILSEAFSRGLWLLEIMGQMSDPDGRAVLGVSRLLETYEQCEQSLKLERGEFAEVLKRVAHDRTQGPALRGAATGALWVLDEANVDRVRADLKLFADPERLGDFLTGLFAVAREVAQRHQQLLLAVDELLAGYADDQFLMALPSLRLAFTYFTPREKHYLATTLLQALGLKPTEVLAALEVSPADAARALALEGRVFAAIERFGLRIPGGNA